MEPKPILVNAAQPGGFPNDLNAGNLSSGGLPANPFVGLRPFESTEDVLFFGRRQQMKELLNILNVSRFVAVVGSSGSGKSSLVRAGLIPNLEAGFLAGAVHRWSIAKMKPGNAPLRNLGLALLRALEGEPDTSRIDELLKDMRRRGVSAVTNFLESKLPRDMNLLLLVDQFEEIFRFGSYDDDIEKVEAERSKTEQHEKEVRRGEAADLVSIMLGLTRPECSRVYVVMTMRSDFLGDCDAFYGLPEAMNQSQYLVPRLTKQQKQESIENPIRLYGATITQRLSDRVLNDMEDERDQLPIMQHAMMRTWERWQPDRTGPVDLHHYEEAGTIREALSLDARNALEGASAHERVIAELMFQALTDTDAKGRRLRRPARLSEIIRITDSSKQAVLDVIERFRANNRSFLSFSEDPWAGDPLVDISHESLIRQWETLRNWVDDEVKSKELYLRLAGDAVRHREQEAPLWSDPALQLALNWWDKRQPNEAWARRYHKEFVLAEQFLRQSERKRAADELEAARLRDEQARREREELEKAQKYAEEQQRIAEVQKAQAEELAASRQRELEAAQMLAQQRQSSVRRARVFSLLFLGFSVLAIATAAWAVRAQAQAKESAKRALASEKIANDAKTQIETQANELIANQKELELANTKLILEKERAETATENAIRNQKLAEAASSEAKKQAAVAEAEKIKANSERTKAVNALKKADQTASADAENWLATKNVKAANREPDLNRRIELFDQALTSYNSSIDKYKQLGQLDTAASVHTEAGQALLESRLTEKKEVLEPVPQNQTPIKADWVSSQLLRENITPDRRFAGMGLHPKQKEGLDHLGKAINIYHRLAGNGLAKGGASLSEVYNNSATAFQDVAEFLNPFERPGSQDDKDNFDLNTEGLALIQASIYSYCAARDDYARAGNIQRQILALISLGDRLSLDSTGSITPESKDNTYFEGCQNGPDEAIGYYEQTIPLYRRLAEQSASPEQRKKRRDAHIDMLLKIAAIYKARDNEENEKQALLKVREAAKLDLTTTADKLLALAGDAEDSKSWYYSLALQQYHDAKNYNGEAETLTKLGNTYVLSAVSNPETDRVKEYEKALEYFQQAVKLYDQTGNGTMKAGALNAMGAAYYQLMDPDKSIETYKRALEILTPNGDKRLQGRAHYGIGRAQEKKVLKEQAIASYTLARMFARESRDINTDMNAAKGLSRLRSSSLPSPSPAPSPSPVPSPGTQFTSHPINSGAFVTPVAEFRLWPMALLRNTGLHWRPELLSEPHESSFSLGSWWKVQAGGTTQSEANERPRRWDLRRWHKVVSAYGQPDRQGVQPRLRVSSLLPSSLNHVLQQSRYS